MSDDVEDAPRKTVAQLIEELKRLDPNRPIVFGVVLDSEDDDEDSEVEIYDMDLIREIEGEDGPGYVILCDLREDEEDEEDDEAA
ncbi:hypothetical protein ACE7GA_13445 [Roseomonas sp. CCTCC AB2023176]|uniref:hypothetical protein n=1 Tax=Roseomonas sp. CCTCC AB2023176 TaxID=3342640 RepID=UPI0035E1F21A